MRRASAYTIAIAMGFATLSARAQAPAEVCLSAENLRPALIEALRVELMARGIRLRLDAGAVGDGRGLVCEPSDPRALRLRLESDDPLGASWVVAEVDPPRRARIESPLDVVDARVFALLVSSVLEEQPSLEPVSPPEEPVEDVEEDEAPPGASVDPRGEPAEPSEDAPADPSSPEVAAPPTASVLSTRHLGNQLGVSLSAVGTLFRESVGLVGGDLGLEIYLSRSFRFDVTLRGAGWDRRGEFSAGLGVTGLIDLVEDDMWLELGVALVGSFVAFEQGPWILAGLVPYVGWLQRVSDVLRIAVRAHAGVTIDAEAFFGSELVGETALVIFP